MPKNKETYTVQVSGVDRSTARMIANLALTLTRPIKSREVEVDILVGGPIQHSGTVAALKCGHVVAEQF